MKITAGYYIEIAHHRPPVFHRPSPLNKIHASFIIVSDYFDADGEMQGIFFRSLSIT